MAKRAAARSNKTKPAKGSVRSARVTNKMSKALMTVSADQQDPPIFVKPGSLVISVEGSHGSKRNRLTEAPKTTGFDYVHSNSTGQILGLDLVDPNHPHIVIQHIPLPGVPFWLRILYS